MPSFYIPLSGLQANSDALSVTANNLANLNTIGYKTQRPLFEDLFYQQIGTSGDGNAEQVGVGATVQAIDSQFTQGSIQSSGVPTDVAIQGDGFFVTDNGGERLFTRAGDFSLSADGHLLTKDGGEVLGYPAVNGVVNPNSTLTPLIISTGSTNPPKATTQAQVNLNLNASAVAGSVQQSSSGISPSTVLKTGSVISFTDGTNTFTYTTVAGDTLANVVTAINANTHFTANLNGNSLNISAVNGNNLNFTQNTLTDAATGNQSEPFTVSGSTFSTSVAVFDALGATHVLSYNFTKTGTNTWHYSISVPGADVGQASDQVISQGILTFNGAGQLVSPAANIAGININNFVDGASPLTFSWNLFDKNGGGLLSQDSGPSAASKTIQDSYSTGSLSSYIIGSDGTIQGTFSNGQTAPLGQIALASFSNDQGLVRNGSNDFLASLSSGQANIGIPGTGGRGKLSGGSLEQSNVDIATQFAQLILEQRGYQANAKAVTTFDEVTQTAINLKQ